MRVEGDYTKLLSDSFKMELVWLEEEFDTLFSNKEGKFVKRDKETAAQILDNILENIDALSNENLLNFLTNTLEKIEDKYPSLFSSS